MYRLYQAALNRAPDKEGLGWWINVPPTTARASMDDAPQGFMHSPEWARLYGANVERTQGS
jgi:serralysin